MALRSGGRETGGEVLLEFQQVGNAVRVTAMDPVTATEVTIVGAPSAGRDILTRNAVRKLDYVLAKRAGGTRGGRGRA
ncbi:MAG: hypothetical protein O3A96_13515 [Proteobacteria bacterium]|nr:hypothetical protein [Pseudomonadota bacterium]